MTKTKKKIKDIYNTRLRKFKKPLIVIGIVIASIVTIVIAFISPITKYLVERYDEKYTGRRITMDWAYVNPFTGYIHLHNLKIYECKSDSIFFSSKGFSVNIELLKLPARIYEISEFSLNQPRGMVIQKGTTFNFNDILELFVDKEKPDVTRAPVRFNVLNLKIRDGEFYYSEKLIPLGYFIKNVNIESSGKRWDSDTIETRFSFTAGIGGGEVKGNITLNIETLEYRFAVVVKKFDMNIINQYLKDLTNYGTFRAYLDADVKAKGNFNDEEDVTASGRLTVSDFHFGEDKGDDYTSFDKLVISIKELSPKKFIYIFDSVSLSNPYFQYEIYDNVDNMETLFGNGGSNVLAANANPYKFNLILEVGKYLKVLARNFMQSYYKIDRLAIYNGNFRFNDYSISEKFNMELNPLYFKADSIDKNQDWAMAYCRSGIKPYGDVAVSFRLNPKDTGDFDIEYRLQKVSMAMFNPYVIAQSSFPMDRGTLEFHGNWNVRDGRIKSVNHLVVIDPRVTKRIKNDEANWLPVPLIVALVRERGNIIDYRIPLTGDLSDPKFHWKDVVFDLIRNIFLKPATMPYRVLVKNTDREIEKSITLCWDMRRSTFQAHQKEFIQQMVTFLHKHPEAKIVVYPQQYTLKEKEYILFFEAKKKYYLLRNQKTQGDFSEADSNKVDRMSIKDTLFVNYLNEQTRGRRLFAVQEKCAVIVLPGLVNAKLAQLARQREESFRYYFSKGNVNDQVSIAAIKTVIPYNGFSFFKIVYLGGLPEQMKSAYNRMNKLNDRETRKSLGADRNISVKEIHRNELVGAKKAK